LAGDGVLDKSWSANKLFDEFALKENKIERVVDFDSLPITGETETIYLTLDNNKLYRWTGTVYIQLNIPSLQEVTDIESTTSNTISIAPFTNTNGLNINTTGACFGIELIAEQVGIDVRSENDRALVAYSENAEGAVIGNGLAATSPILILENNGLPKFQFNTDGSLKLDTILDVSNSKGTSGQILSSTGTGIDWIDANTLPANTNNWSLLGNSGTNPAINFIGTTDDVDLVFKRFNNEFIRFLGTGTIGINQSALISPFTPRLMIADENSNEGIVILQHNNTAANPPQLSFYRSRGTKSSPSQVLLGDTLMIIGSRGYNNVGGYSGRSASMQVIATENYTSTGIGSRIQFLTTPTGSTTASIRLIIDANGNVGFGSVTPTKTLDVNGEARIRTLPAGLSTENILVANGSGDIRSRALFSSVPATATSTGTAGQMAYDSSFFYICTATNTWRRVAIASW
jgi:hypothetical protein